MGGERFNRRRLFGAILPGLAALSALALGKKARAAIVLRHVSLNPDSPQYDPTAKNLRPVLNGRRVTGLYEVNEIEGWAEGREARTTAGGYPHPTGRRVYLVGPVRLVPKEDAEGLPTVAAHDVAGAGFLPEAVTEAFRCPRCNKWVERGVMVSEDPNAPDHWTEPRVAVCDACSWRFELADASEDVAGTGPIL